MKQHAIEPVRHALCALLFACFIAATTGDEDREVDASEVRDDERMSAPADIITFRHDFLLAARLEDEAQRGAVDARRGL